jgi:hypothetical protein
MDPMEVFPQRQMAWIASHVIKWLEQIFSATTTVLLHRCTRKFGQELVRPKQSSIEYLIVFSEV